MTPKPPVMVEIALISGHEFPAAFSRAGMADHLFSPRKNLFSHDFPVPDGCGATRFGLK
jgi:hypothetical protein